jgi:drug/metabolite transporter (DMT)-like permease
MADAPMPETRSAKAQLSALAGESAAFGAFLRVLSTVCFALMNLFIKLASDGYPTGEIIFARSFFGVVPVLVLAAATTGLLSAFRTRNLTGHLVRGAVGGTGMVLGFVSIGLLPLASSTAIGYATPLMTVILGAALLGEVVRVHRWTAVIIGLVGVFLILSDYIHGTAGAESTSLLGAAAGLAATLTAALVTIHIRQMHRTETSNAIVTYFSLFCTLMSFASIPLGWLVPALAWRMPDAGDAMLLIATGLVGGLGQVTMTQSLRYAEVSSVAPFNYLTLIWTIFLGYFTFGDVPTQAMLAGSAIVVASGLYVIYRERQLARRGRLKRRG